MGIFSGITAEGMIHPPLSDQHILILLKQNVFGSTECGPMLLSIGGKGHTARLLRPLEGVSYGFSPIDPSTPSESTHQSTGRMLELVILSESRDCPALHMRRADGHFHTGDLFQEVSPGLYVSRGRNDDWIKSDNGLRCDTKCVSLPLLH
jgi:hypothetical protein